MAKANIEQLVEQLVQDIIHDSDIELVDVEYVKERDWYLRVFIDKPGSIEVDDCQMISEQLEKKLDALDPIKESYYLEVSSPGLDRPLKKDKDFTRHIGDKIEIHTFAPINGEKTIIGILKAFDDNNITVDVNDMPISIPREKISQVRLYLEF